jgi:hypothetical protein
MKRLFFSFLITCSFCISSFAQDIKSVTIKISPLGEPPKPIPTLFICSAQSPLYANKFFNKIVITDEASLKAAMSFINTHPSAIKGLAKKSYPYGSFQIALYNGSEYIGGYVLTPVTQSRQYFQSFVNSLNKGRADELLTYQINSLLSRIK